MEVVPDETTLHGATLSMHPKSTIFSAIMLLAVLSSSLWANAAFGDTQAVHFDLAHTTKATPVESDQSLVRCELHLSSLVIDANALRVDQWIVRCSPRDSAMQIFDYFPRTEAASDIDGSIQIKSSQESTQSFGIGIDGQYAKAISWNIGADAGGKQTETKTFNRVAPVQAVTVSGTYDRGRGVYFKLHSTAKQILEGEKVFRLTLRVPRHWSGGIIDVSVTANSSQRGFANWDSRSKQLATTRFAVAAYRDGDDKAATLAMQIADRERELRRVHSRHADSLAAPTLPLMLRHVAAKLNLDSTPPKTDWIDRLIAGQTDPYMDSQISRLPMEVRVAVIEYHEARNRLTRLGG